MINGTPILGCGPAQPPPCCDPRAASASGAPCLLGQLWEDRCPGLVTQWLLSQCPSPSLHGKRAGILLGHLWALCVGCASHASCIH